MKRPLYMINQAVPYILPVSSNHIFFQSSEIFYLPIYSQVWKNKILNPNLLPLGLGECAGPHLGVDGFIPINPLQALASTLVLVFPLL